MIKTVRINGYKSIAKSFAYDSCHKIYLIEDDENHEKIDQALEWGYAILPIEDLERIYKEDACPLRFIQTWGDLDSIVDQGERTANFYFYKREKNYD